MRKTSKSKLLQELEMDAETISELPDGEVSKSCFIVDLMGVVQSINKSSSKTFGELCTQLVLSISQYFHYAEVLVITPDRYDIQHSIKCFERARRTTSAAKERVTQSSSTPLPVNFKEFLGNPKNKSNFVNFFLNFAMKSFQRTMD